MKRIYDFMTGRTSGSFLIYKNAPTHTRIEVYRIIGDNTALSKHIYLSSEHEIMIYSLAENVVEALGGITAVIIYIAICMVAAAVFVSSIYVRRKI